MPVRRPGPILDQCRHDLHASAQACELIMVCEEGLQPALEPLRKRERLMVQDRVGRGYAFQQGLPYAQGAIVLLLHDDTLLPDNGLALVAAAMQKPGVVGGAFRLRFDWNEPLLNGLTDLSNWLSSLLSEYWGDHAMFVRRELLLREAGLLEVPLMEDVRLSKAMRRWGKTSLLDAYVTSSADAFRRRGVLGHTLRIIRCRLGYALGASPESLFKLYYR